MALRHTWTQIGVDSAFVRMPPHIMRASTLANVTYDAESFLSLPTNILCSRGSAFGEILLLFSFPAQRVLLMQVKNDAVCQAGHWPP